MKKIITLSLACVLFVGIGQAQAQTEAHPWGVKVGFGLSGIDAVNYSIMEYPRNNLMETLGISYYINDRFDLAFNANFFVFDNYQQAATTNIVYYKTASTSFSLLLHYKFLETRLKPYIALGAAINFMKDRVYMRAFPYRDNIVFSLPMGVGFNYKLSEYFSFNLQLIYHWTFTDDIIDSYPVSAGKLRGSRPGHPSNPDDRNTNDKFLLTTAGIIFNFGGEETHKCHCHPILHQSMKNMRAVQNVAEQAANVLIQVQQLNDQTLAALQSLKQAQQMNDNEANELKEQFVHIVNNIQFAFDKSYLLPTSKTELSSLANIMNHYPGLQIDIAGHADLRGSKKYNVGLSKRRVQTVKQYLMSHGVSASQITTNAYGETEDLLHPSTSSADLPTVYAQNRAVQLTLSYHNPESR